MTREGNDVGVLDAGIGIGAERAYRKGRVGVDLARGVVAH
jgi:hypothetical protein